MKEKANIQSLTSAKQMLEIQESKEVKKSKMSKSNIRNDKIFERHQPHILRIELTSSAIPNTSEVRYFKVTVPNNQAHPSMTLKNIFRMKWMFLTFMISFIF